MPDNMEKKNICISPQAPSQGDVFQGSGIFVRMFSIGEGPGLCVGGK